MRTAAPHDKRRSASEEDGQTRLDTAQPVELEDVGPQLETAVAQSDATAQVVGLGLRHLISAAHLDIGREAALEQIGLRVEEEGNHHLAIRVAVVVTGVQTLGIRLEDSDAQTCEEVLAALSAVDGREGKAVAPEVGRSGEVDVAALNQTAVSRAAFAELAALRPDGFRRGDRNGLPERGSLAGRGPECLGQHERRPHRIGTTHGIDGPDVLERGRAEPLVAGGIAAHREPVLGAEPVPVSLVAHLGLDQQVGRPSGKRTGNQRLALSLHGRRALEEVIRPGRIDLDPNGRDVKFGNRRHLCDFGTELHRPCRLNATGYRAGRRKEYDRRQQRQPYGIVSQTHIRQRTLFLNYREHEHLLLRRGVAQGVDGLGVLLGQGAEVAVACGISRYLDRRQTTLLVVGIGKLRLDEDVGTRLLQRLGNGVLLLDLLRQVLAVLTRADARHLGLRNLQVRDVDHRLHGGGNPRHARRVRLVDTVRACTQSDRSRQQKNSSFHNFVEFDLCSRTPERVIA